MKKLKKLSLHKSKIAKLQQLNKLVGGIYFNNELLYNNEDGTDSRNGDDKPKICIQTSKRVIRF